MQVVFWHWWALAGVLLALEVVAPGIFFLWVALGAVVSGLISLLMPTLGWEIEGVIMVAVALITALTLKRYYPKIHFNTGLSALNRRGERNVGRIATLEQPIVNGEGRLKLDGTHWSVRGPDMPAGARVRITGAEGATLRVEPE